MIQSLTRIDTLIVVLRLESYGGWNGNIWVRQENPGGVNNLEVAPETK